MFIKPFFWFSLFFFRKESNALKTQNLLCSDRNLVILSMFVVYRGKNVKKYFAVFVWSIQLWVSNGYRWKSAKKIKGIFLSFSLIEANLQVKLLKLLKMMWIVWILFNSGFVDTIPVFFMLKMNFTQEDQASKMSIKLESLRR